MSTVKYQKSTYKRTHASASDPQEPLKSEVGIGKEEFYRVSEGIRLLSTP